MTQSRQETIRFPVFSCIFLLNIFLFPYTGSMNEKNILTPEEMDILLRSVLFAGIRKEDLPHLLSCLKVRKKTYEKGEWIFDSGQKMTHIGLILHGSAKIVRFDFWGNRHIISPLLESDVFGESYAADQSTGMVGIQADEQTAVLLMNPDKILSMCQSACSFHARLIRNLVLLLAKRNRILNEKLTVVTQPSLRDKILAYLQAESLRQHRSYFDIPFDRQQLADYLNADRSALSSELSRLKKDGIIDYQKNHFHLIVSKEEFQES